MIRHFTSTNTQMLGLDFGLKENIGKKRKGDGQKVNGHCNYYFGREGRETKGNKVITYPF